MKVSRLLASILIAALLGAAGIAWGGDTEQEQVFSPPVTSAPTTTEPEYSAIVQSGVAATPFEAEESELTEAALSRTTSTTTTTTTPTTTTTATTTTTTAEPPATAARSSSPGTTEAPSAPDPPPSNAGFSSSAESDFAGKINSHRGGAGLGALTRSGSLDSYARSWAKKMAASGSLSHSNIGSLLGSWSAAAENVGMGGSVSAIFSALAGSSGHNTNMLGDYTHMGIGAWVDDNGMIWTAHVFTR